MSNILQCDQYLKQMDELEATVNTWSYLLPNCFSRRVQ